VAQLHWAAVVAPDWFMVAEPSGHRVQLTVP
jgi:hypothetical protein